MSIPPVTSRKELSRMVNWADSQSLYGLGIVPHIWDYLRGHPELANWATWEDELVFRMLGRLQSRPRVSSGSTTWAMAAYRTFLDDLGFCDAPPLEQVVLARLAVSWSVLLEVEYSYALALNQDSPQAAAFWEDRLSAAHQRFDRALSMLERIRKVPRSVLEALMPKEVNVTSVASQPNPTEPDEPLPPACGLVKGEDT